MPRAEKDKRPITKYQVPRIVIHLRVIYFLVIVVLISFGLVDLYFGNVTGGRVFTRYGSSNLSYGGWGYFIMAGILLIFPAYFWVFKRFTK